MSRLDKALSRLAERGNPTGPDVMLDRLESLLSHEAIESVVVLQRRTTMQETIQTKPERSQPPRNHKLLALIAGAAVFIAAIGVVGVLVSRSDEPDVAATVPSLEAAEWCRIGTEFGDAFAIGEYDTVILLDQDWIASAPAEIEAATRKLIEELSGGPSTFDDPSRWAEPVAEIEAFRALHCAGADLPGF